MRGDQRVQDGMFSYVSLEQRVPQDHPLRAVRKLTDTVLGTQMCIRDRHSELTNFAGNSIWEPVDKL